MLLEWDSVDVVLHTRRVLKPCMIRYNRLVHCRRNRSCRTCSDLGSDPDSSLGSPKNP